MHVPFADPFVRREMRVTTSPDSSHPVIGRDTELLMGRMVMQTVLEDRLEGARALTISGEMGIGKTRLLTTLCQEATMKGCVVYEARAYEAGGSPYAPFVAALRPLLHTASPEQLRNYVGVTLPPAPTLSSDLSLAGLPFKDNRERRLDAAAEDATDEHCLLSFREDTLLASQASAVTRLNGLPLVTTLCRLFPELPSLLQMPAASNADSDSVAHFTVTAEQEKFFLFDAIATLLERAASVQPLVVAIDNAQWADSVSLELMLYLVVRLRKSRVALLSATRPPRLAFEGAEDADQATAGAAAAARILGDLLLRGLLLFLPLGPLSQEAAAAYLRSLLPGVVPDHLAQALLTRAEGNPFFLEELVRAVTLHNQLMLRDGVWRTSVINNTKLPTTIVQVVKQRLQELSAPCHELLQVAALYGRTFPAGALSSVVQRSEEEIAALLDEAMQALLILPVAQEDQVHELYASFSSPSSSNYLFSQGIVYEVLAGEIPPQRAGTLHGLIGDALETLYAHDSRSHPATLAQHYMLGGKQEKALYWSMVAGEEVLSRHAYREAIRHFRQALKLLEAGVRHPDLAHVPDSAELYAIIGEAWVKTGELEPASQALLQSLQHLKQQSAPSPLLLARVNRFLADVYRVQERYDQAIAHLVAARTAIEKVDSRKEQYTLQVDWIPHRRFSVDAPILHEHADINERIQVLQAQGTLYIFLNQPQGAESTFWEAHQLAIEIGDQNSQAFALHMIGWVRGWDARIEDTLRLLKQAHELYILLGDPFHAALGEQGLGIIYQALGEMEQARAYTLRGLERAQRYGVSRVMGWLYWNMSVMALNQGQWSLCQQYLQKAVQEVQSHNETRLQAVIAQVRGCLYMRQGQHKEAEQAFQEAVRAATNTDWIVSSLVLYGHFLALTGNRTLARVQLDRAIQEYPEPASFSGTFYIPFLVEAYLQLDMPEQAALYAERLRPLRTFLYYGCSAGRIEGMLAMQRKEWNVAEEAFAQALSLCKMANNAPDEATIYDEQDRLARLREEPAVSSSPKPAEERSSEAEAYDDSPLLSLTKRELEVLRLVAEGHTDREVAELLIISPRTVNRHLSNIFVKLDVPGRAAAVAYAIRQHLV